MSSPAKQGFLPPPKRKSRVLTIRLSETEYAEVRRDTEALGARTVSDFARARLLTGALTGDVKLEEDLRRLEAKLAEVNGTIRRLAAFVGFDNSQ